MLRKVTLYTKYLVYVTLSNEMVKCDYCETRLDRHAFCNSAHKMQFHRHNVTISNKIKENVTLRNEIPKKIQEIVTERNIVTCKHGAMLGLCKHGCTK